MTEISRDLVKKLGIIVHYYRMNRAVGHTEAVIRGVQNMNRIAVLTPVLRIGDMFKRRNPKVKVISWSTNIEESLASLDLPLVVDHTTTEVICLEALKAIAELQRELDDLKAKNIRWAEQQKGLKKLCNQIMAGMPDY